MAKITAGETGGATNAQEPGYFDIPTVTPPTVVEVEFIDVSPPVVDDMADEAEDVDPDNDLPVLSATKVAIAPAVVKAPDLAPRK